MAIFLFVYGTQHHCVRIGFSGARPLIYGLYAYDDQNILPAMDGQTYRSITKEQYDWVREHLNCDVSFMADRFDYRFSIVECRTHSTVYQVFELSPIYLDDWEERLV
jgi:hypothetical protein